MFHKPILLVMQPKQFTVDNWLFRWLIASPCFRALARYGGGHSVQLHHFLLPSASPTPRLPIYVMHHHQSPPLFPQPWPNQNYIKCLIWKMLCVWRISSTIAQTICFPLHMRNAMKWRCWHVDFMGRLNANMWVMSGIVIIVWFHTGPNKT